MQFSPGIGMVHQHFMLIPRLTVAENVVLGAEPRKRRLFDRKRACEAVAEFSRQYEFMLPSKAVVCDVSLGMQQRVEIAESFIQRG